MRKHQEPKPRDDKDPVQDKSRDLAEIASHIGQLKGDANAYLTDPNYNRLKLRLEYALCGGGGHDRGEAQGAPKRGAIAVSGAVMDEGSERLLWRRVFEG
jgi:hypothetical protein